MIRRSIPLASLVSLLPLVLAASAVAQDGGYSPSPAAVVRLRSGRLQGAEPAPGVRAYLGIPYAKPPVGPLRWRAPQPFGSLNPTANPSAKTAEAPPRLAVAHGAPCAQQRFGWNNGAADHGTEDCLFLNVWAPAAGSRLPVMVYIHGGSNTAGSASEELSNGLALVPRGIVLVTFDYRLGIFGFLRTPGLDAETAYHGSGDYGLMDQIAALRWVRENIAAFGGDPAKVTLFGQSAGAVDTGLLMTSPPARGLFAGALEESGQVLGLMPTATREQSEQAWATVAQQLGVDAATMRRASTAEVLAAEHAAPSPPANRFWGFRGASVDGYILPELPAEVFAHGEEAPVPLLLGSNVQEIVPRNQPAEQTHRLIEDTTGRPEAIAGMPAADRLAAVYASPAANMLEGDAGARFQTDRDFRCPVLQVARWHAAHGFPTFVYQFDRSAGSGRAAQHSSELRFVFGFPAHTDATAEDQKVAGLVERYWTSFARSGTPDGSPGKAEARSIKSDGPDGMPAAEPAWPRFSPARDNFLHFRSGSVEPVEATNLGGTPCSILTANNLPGGH